MFSSLIFALALGLAPQHWTAVSTTAMSITGDVSFSSTRMVFSDGKSIALSFYKKAPQYALYRILGKVNPSLLRGNPICGPKLPGYVAVARNGRDVNVSFFGSGVPPQNLNAPSLCATYLYQTG